MERLTTKLHDFGAVLYINEVGKHLSPAELSVGQTREVLHKLCEYEETGFTPEQIMEMKKSANIKKCQRTRIVIVPEAKIFTQVVSRYGLQINGKKYYLPDLVFSHLGYRVKIKIQGHMVDVYDFHNDNHLENFEL